MRAMVPPRPEGEAEDVVKRRASVVDNVLGVKYMCWLSVFF